MDDYAESKLLRIEAWFRERGVTLEYSQVGDPEDIMEWVALMIPDGHKAGLVEGGGGVTRLAAAEDAQQRYRAAHGDDVASPEPRVEGRAEVRADVTVEAVPATATAEAVPPAVKIEPEGLVHKREIGKPTVTAIPDDVRDPLEAAALEFGWRIGFVREPDASLRWFVIDLEEEMILKSGVADTWDDARIAVIEDIYPPSGEA